MPNKFLHPPQAPTGQVDFFGLGFAIRHGCIEPKLSQSFKFRNE
jgi:hypothetical protein